MTYKYDHIAEKLLFKEGWIRVPWYIPGTGNEREEGFLRPPPDSEHYIKHYKDTGFILSDKRKEQEWYMDMI